MRRFGTQWKEMQTVARYILQRLGQTLLILLIVSFITYLLIDFLPGDPIAAMLGGEISQETYDWWYQELNLDKPVLIRYVLWLKNALMGDFGHSASYSVPVLQIIGERVPVTLYLSVLAFLISVPLGILFGIISAVKRGKPADTAVTLTANVCCCLPQFWLGILLMYIFTIVLKWLPSSGWVWPWEDFGESVRRTIMPLTCLTIGGIVDDIINRTSEAVRVIPQIVFAIALCAVFGGGILNLAIVLGISNTTVYIRMMRSQVLSIKERDYIMAGKLQGNSNFRLMFHHILPNSISPIIVTMTQQVGNTILSEAGLSFLGLGISKPTATWGALVNGGRSFLLTNPIYSLAPGIAIALLVICLNTLGDGVRDALDPRLRGEV